MEIIVIVAYKPFEGKESELIELTKTHWERLKKENLVSERRPVILQSKGGTVIEIFGWRSKEAIEQAHSNEAVKTMWKEFSQVCEYIPMGEVEECATLFSEFKPVEV